MEEKFSSWLVRAEGKLEATGRSYSRAINRLSEHYTCFTGIPTDIYSVDQEHLVKIKMDYDTKGRFSEKGYETHGLYRAAIKAYYRFKLANPDTPISIKNKITVKPTPIQKKQKRKSFIQKIIVFFTSIFQRKKQHKIPSDYFVGTKKQISRRLLPLLPSWEEESNKDYLVENPRCHRCNSMEFPEVVEQHPLNSKKLLKTILKDFPNEEQQSVSISKLATQYKRQFTANDDKLMVLCRTCKQQEENRKIERYPHEVPPVMRKGPPELRY